MISDLKQGALHRSKILAGQLQGIERMIEQEIYCVDILTQSLAIQQGLKRLNKLILENHLRTHVEQDLTNSRAATREKSVAELLDLYELFQVRG